MLSHGDEIGAAAQALADDFHAAISTLSRMQAVPISLTPAVDNSFLKAGACILAAN
jgi:hypothetical protein